VWPLYYSAKKFNNCEEEDMRRAVKYWCILGLEYLLEKLLALIIFE
jgi:hypothetical protein